MGAHASCEGYVPEPFASHLPAGVPSWWRGSDSWAARVGPTTQEKRATIEVVVPTGDRTWPER